MLNAVIFDMDGLLIDSEAFWQEEEVNVFRSLGVPISLDMLKETYGLGTNEVIAHWHSFKPWTGVSFTEVRETIFTRMEKRIQKESVLKEGAIDVLQYFRKKKMPIALASASPFSIINAVLDTFGIREQFDFIHSCEREEYEKPHPAIFLSVAKQFNVKPSSCLVFEDSFVGLLAAKAARMKSCVVPNPNHFTDERFVIADLKIESLGKFTDDHYNYLNKIL